MSDALRPILRSTRETTYPGEVVGTSSAVNPRVPACGSVTAITTATSADLPLVTNCFVPSSR